MAKLRTKREPASATWRPTVAGSHYAVSSGHYLATAAAMRVLDAGGNAVDAGVTAALALSILQPDVVSFAGVAPTLVYLKAENCVLSLAGLGHWPAATDVARLRAEGGKSVPEGILRQVVPAAPATHIEALRRLGSLSFEQAVMPAYQLARDGFYVYPELHGSIEIHGGEIDRYAENAAIFRPGGRTPPIGSRLRQGNLARTIERMIEAERKAPGDRAAKLRAAHDCFYKGSIAQDIAGFHRRHGGFMTREDLAGFEVPVETSIAVRYRDFEIHSCDVWCQGIVLLESLKILEGLDLQALGWNSVGYLHALSEAMNLAFADREAYVGDPKFITVPTRELLSAEYAARQRARIQADRAFGRMPQPGLGSPNRETTPSSGEVPVAPDTIYCCVADKYGNAFSATPSDTMYDTPMVEGLGFAPSARGTQGRLEPDHPLFVQPGKRPRLTPNPALALRGNGFAMAWGTPGGDVQCASMLQVFLNATEWGLSLQEAIEAPRVAPFSFPNSFAPNEYFPGRLCVENRFPQQTIAALEKLGHDVELWPEKSWSMGSVCAILRDPASGLLHAGADPRRPGYALAW
ncbi:MAG TPA: gamma-glutamyltransferase [Burkholderiales bacterium]|nr:gamma-glutamyltransferase [Burkholderiales bacterium]